MKHSEFKRKVEEFGFEIRTNMFGESDVFDSNNNLIARIDEKYPFRLATTFRLSTMSTALERERLSDILVEYSRTLIEDRRDEKTYLIYPVKTLNYNLVRFDHTFRRCGYEDEDSFGIFSPPLLSYRDVSMAFSESEAREICDYFGWDFNKVVVEVEDDE